MWSTSLAQREDIQEAIIVEKEKVIATRITPSSLIQALLARNLSQDISKIVKEYMDEDALMKISLFAYAKEKEQSEKNFEKRVKILEQVLDKLKKTLPTPTPL